MEGKPHTVVQSQFSKAVTTQEVWPICFKLAAEADKYMPVQEFQVTEQTDDHMMRTMVMGPAKIVEKVTWDKSQGMLTFQHTEASQLKGMVNIHVKQCENGCYLEMMSSAFNDKGMPFPPQEMFQKICDTTKQKLEQQL